MSAFVTGVGGPAGRATTSFLRESGVAVVVADARAVDAEPGLVTLPPAVEGRFLETLCRELQARGARLLVPTVTEELPKVAAHREALRASGCAVFISPPAAAEVANDKWLTVQALARARVGVPRSVACVPPNEIVQRIGFPMLSKPRRGRGGRGVLLYEHPEAIDADDDRIYQEFLPGEEYDVNLFAEAGGEPAALVVLRKTSLREGRVGNAVSVERVEAADVADVAAAASRALGLEGPIDIDVRRDRLGRPLVLEVNARVGANVRAADEVLDTLVDRWRRLS